MSAKRGFDRIERIASLIQQTIAHILLTEINDNRFRTVTVTDVRVARDLSFARIYVSMLDDNEAEIKSLLEALNQEVSFVRYQLAHKIKLRIVPELRFYFDDSTAHGFYIDHLISKTDSNKNK